MEVSRSTKLTILSLLVLQNATQTLLMRYSRGVLNETYHITTVVIMTEVSKFMVCILLIILGIGESGIKGNVSIISKLFYLIKNSGYTWVPALCYFIQNTLNYIASENLPSSVFAVLQQMKILSAALASVAILRRHLEWRQWRALLLLIAGGFLMDYHSFSLNDSGVMTNNNNPIKGTIAMFTMVSLSGFAGVMTELLLKNKTIRVNDDNNQINGNDIPSLSIWDRNIQLSFWSIILGFVSLIIDRSWMDDGVFSGWSHITVLLVVIWTAGGLLVALTIKYTNVIIKGFASAISLILICCGGAAFLNDYLDVIFLVGATVTIIASFNYNDKDVNKLQTNKPQIINNNNPNTIDGDIGVIANVSEIEPLTTRNTTD